MKRSAVVVLASVWLIQASFAQVAPVKPAPAKPAPAKPLQERPSLIVATSFASRAICEQADKLSSEQCGFAFTNARAEFEEKAPRFRARHDCIRAHKICSAQIVGNSGFNAAAQATAIYVPSFQGVTLVAAKGNEAATSVMPRIGAGASRFRARSIDKLDDKVDGRVAVVPDSQARGASRGGRVGSNDPQSSGPYVRRGERDDTIKTRLEVRNPNDPTATGLFVDKDGVEWYRPTRRR